jgi:hypothetical protein
VRQVFKGDNYSREETIVSRFFEVYTPNLNCCRKLVHYIVASFTCNDTFCEICYEAHLKVKLARKS